MTRFSSKAADEVPDKHSDNAKQRTRPAVNRGPPSPRAISALYDKGKEFPLGRRSVTHEHQKNQSAEDKHAPGYDNDCSGWVRSQGENSTVNRPGGFDRGKLDPSSKPPRPASGLKASGADMQKSPFSAAYRKGAGEGF